MHVTQLIKTDETMSYEEAVEMYCDDIDCDPLPAVISVCAGEWRDNGKCFEWWKNPELDE
jgi:hypothetical protein